MNEKEAFDMTEREREAYCHKHPNTNLQSTGLTRIYVFVQYEQENVIIEEEKIISAPLMPFVY